MKTVILMWNPAISSFRMQDFKKCVGLLRNNCEEEITFEHEEEREYVDMNWSIWEHKKVHYGDRFFMVRVGEGKTGIVMSGSFNSSPYKGEDWSGKGRKTYYSDLLIDCMVDTEKMPYISTEQLTETLPDFDWTGGHSGRVLSRKMADKLEEIWAEYFYKYYGLFDFTRGATTLTPSEMPYGLKTYLQRKKEAPCEICGYDYKKIWGKDSDHHNNFVRYIPRRTDVKSQNGDNVWQHIHCVCGNCCGMDYDQLAKKLGEEDYLKDDDFYL